MLAQQQQHQLQQDTRLFFTAIEDKPDYADLTCASCSFIKVTFACSLCKTRQCAECIKNFHLTTLSTADVAKIPPQKFNCIKCYSENNFDDTDFNPSGIADICFTIASKKNDFFNIQREIIHQEEIKKIHCLYEEDELLQKQNNITDKFVKLTTMSRPCCGLPFIDFEACAAIHCDFCNKNFCALCLDFVTEGPKKTHDELIDEDDKLPSYASLHKHVKNSCPFNIHFKGNPFVPGWYPLYCQASRFCSQWNEFYFKYKNLNNDLVQKVLEKILPLVNDSNISFNEFTLAKVIFKDNQKIKDEQEQEEQEEQEENNIKFKFINDERGIRRVRIRRHHNNRRRHQQLLLPPPDADAAADAPADAAAPIGRKRILCSLCKEYGFHNKQTCPKKFEIM